MRVQAASAAWASRTTLARRRRPSCRRSGATWLKFSRRRPRFCSGSAKKGSAGHECDIGGQRRLEQGAGIQRLPEGQPEEQPALRDIPFGQLTEVLQQRLLHGVAADPVELAQFGQVLAVGLAAEPLQRLPLPYPVGMQVGRLFQPQQVGEQVRGGDQETDAQARQQGLRHRAGIDPAGLAQAADQRGCAALVEHQFAIGFVFDQGHAEFV